MNPTPRQLYLRKTAPVPIVQEAGWAPEPVWRGAENLAATGIRCPDRPARSNTDYAIPAHPQLPRGFKSVEEKTLKKEEVGCSQILKASFSNSRRYNYEDTTQSDSITVAYTGLAFGVDGGIIQFKVFNT